jgi:hypothetical protein
MLEKTQGAIKNGQSREIETYSTQYTGRRQTKQKHKRYVFDTTIRKKTQIT